MATIAAILKYADNSDEFVKNQSRVLDSIEITGKSIDRLARQFSDSTVVSNAAKWAAAIEKVGGVTKLSAAEQEKANAIIQKAIDAYARMGEVAPKTLTDLSAELTRANKALDPMAAGMSAAGKAATDSAKMIAGMGEAGQLAADKATAHAAAIGKSSDAMSAAEKVAGPFAGQLLRLAAAFSISGLIDKAVSTLFAWGHEAVAAAGALTDMSAKTGLSVETLQRFDYVGKQAGVTVQDFTDAAFKLGVKLSGGGGSVRQAVDELGLSWQELKKASPDEQFAQIVGKLETMTDTQEKNRLGVELFGKSFSTIAPAVAAGYTAMAAAAKVATTDQVKAIDDLSDAWDRWVAKQKTGLTASLGTIVLVQQEWATLKKELQDNPTPRADAELQAVITATDRTKALLDFARQRAKLVDISLPKDKQQNDLAKAYAEELAKDEASLKALTGEQLTNLQAALKLGKANDEIVNKLGISEGVIKLAAAAFQKQTEAQRKAAEEADKVKQAFNDLNSVGDDWRETLQRMDPLTRAYAMHMLEAGADAGNLKIALGLTDAQMKALTAAMKDNEDIAKRVADAHSDNIDTAAEVTKQFASLRSELMKLATTMGDVQLGSKQIGVGFMALMPDLGAQAARRIREGLDSGLSDAFSHIPDILMRAFEGGGGLLGGLKSIGVSIANEIAGPMLKKLSEAGKQAVGIGAAIAGGVGGALGGGAGATIGSLAGSIGALALSHAGLIASTAALGAATAGIGAAAVGVYLLAKHWLSVSQAEKDARASFEAFNKNIGGSNVNDFIARVSQAGAVLGKNGEEVRQLIQKVLDATHKSPQALADALKPLVDMIDAADAKTKNFSDGLQYLQSSGATAFNAIAAAVQGDKASLEALSAQAVSTFAALVASGMSEAQALQQLGPGLDSIKKAYADLGLNIDNAGLSALLMQKTIADGNPALMAGVSGLAGNMDALQKLGLLNAETFGQMEVTGIAMYQRLQAQAAAAGGSTRDALLPMQQYLHEAEEAAKELGVPLDDNTQMLIDQSKELGIWKDKGKSANEVLLDGMTKLVEQVGKLLDYYMGMPKNVDTTVTTHYVNDGAPGGPPPPDGAATGGVVMPWGIKHFGRGGFVPSFGTAGVDSVPAMLTPGEIVLNSAQQGNVARNLSAGAVVVDMGEFRAMRERQEQTNQELAGLRDYLQSRLSRDLARSVRDGIQRS